MIQFTKATKEKCRLRLALIGVSGGGKTFTALNLAKYLGGKTVVLDSEKGSASKYADLFDFDKFELQSGHPKHYVECIQAAGKAEYTNIIIDSLSHAWVGKDGALELVDKASKSQTGNSFTAWKSVNPHLTNLLDVILTSPANIIVTLRAKMEYLTEKNEQGKTIIRKVGLQPVFRDQLEYELDVVADMDLENNLIVSKTRCVALSGQVINKPGEELANILKGWIGSGSAPEPVKKPVAASPAQEQPASSTTQEKPASAPDPKLATAAEAETQPVVTSTAGTSDNVGPDEIRQLAEAAVKNGWSKGQISEFICARYGYGTTTKVLTHKQWDEAVRLLSNPKNPGGLVTFDINGVLMPLEQRFKANEYLSKEIINHESA